MNSKFFLIEQYSFPAIEEQQFQKAALGDPEERLWSDEEGQRLEPVAAVEKIMDKPRLPLELRCPDCGRTFAADYYEARSPACPGCGVRRPLNPGQARQAFERQLRDALQSTGVTGECLARAAILLEPLFQIFIIRYWSSRIGHFLENTARAVTVLGGHFEPEPLLIFIPPDPEKTANSHVAEQWSRRFLNAEAAGQAGEILGRLKGHRDLNPKTALPEGPGFSRGPDGRLLFQARIQRPRQARHLIDLNELYWIYDNRKDPAELAPWFSFSGQEEEQARQWRQKHGLGERFATFIGRDSAYLSAVAPDEAAAFAFRDMDIKTYLPAMGWLADQGVHSVRMGSRVKELLPADRPEIVDYAGLPDQSPFLDVYLPAASLFHVTCGLGPDMAAYLMKRPLLVLNCTQPATLEIAANNPLVYFAFKKMRRRADGRPMSLRQIFTQKADMIMEAQDYRQSPVLMEDHTAEEISGLVREVFSRVAGTWEVSEHERILQEKYAALVSEFYPSFQFRGRLVYSWLRDNPYLLADA